MFSFVHVTRDTVLFLSRPLGTTNVHDVCADRERRFSFRSNGGAGTPKSIHIRSGRGSKRIKILTVVQTKSIIFVRFERNTNSVSFRRPFLN